MKRRLLKTIGILILMAIMILPPLRTADAAGFNYYTSIFVKKNPERMEYSVGESFDKTGMQIYGNRTKADGKTDTCDLGLDDLKFSPSKFTKGGTIKVTLTLNCMAASGKKEPFSTYLYVTVYEGDPPMYWTKSISAQAKKTVYKVGDSFDKKGLTVWAYSEGDVPPGEEKWNCTSYVKKISPETFTKAGEQYVTVTAHLTTKYSSADFTAKIKVKVYDAIEITKHPGDETVDEGGSCAFTVKSNHAEKYAWYFVKGKTSVSVKDADDFFPGLKVSGGSEKKLKLSDIPIELDGWKVLCEFSNKVETVKSNTASIHVNAKKATPAPTDVPTEPPTAEPTTNAIAEATAISKTDPTAEAIIVPKDTPAPANPEPSGSTHTHSFDGVYHHNSIEHWLECSCGERAAVANHVVTEWKTVTKPTKNTVGVRKGTCAVCGAEILDTVTYDDYDGDETARDPMSWMLIVGLALAGLAGVGCIISFVIVIAKSRKRRRRD